jgi:hypothetical protein
MKARDFCYWLQGFIELSETTDHREGFSKETIECIKRHLAMVFRHDIDPSFGPVEVQEALNDLHSPIKSDDVIMRC